MIVSNELIVCHALFGIIVISWTYFLVHFVIAAFKVFMVKGPSSEH